MALSDKADGILVAREWQPARYFFGLKAFAITALVVGFFLSGQPVGADVPPCPASYASSEQKMACIRDDNCSLRKKWPAESKRLRWVSDEAEAFIESRLSNVNECVSVGDLQSAFDADITECTRREAETAIVLAATRMLNRDRLVANRRGVGKRTRIGLPKLGDCY